MSEPASDAIVALNTAIQKAAGDYAARCGNSEGAWDMHFFPLHNAAVAALAAAREEGRREQREVHAAQLGALREEAWALADGECIAGHMEGCACLVCDTAITIRDAIRAIPLPDAEDALADAVRDTRIDTVRWCHANPVETSQAYEVESADQYVARALAALGAKP